MRPAQHLGKALLFRRVAACPVPPRPGREAGRKACHASKRTWNQLVGCKARGFLRNKSEQARPTKAAVGTTMARPKAIRAGSCCVGTTPGTGRVVRVRAAAILRAHLRHAAIRISGACKFMARGTFFATELLLRRATGSGRIGHFRAAPAQPLRRPERSVPGTGNQT